eukprot:c11157_g1_i1.p1 GENE.c11157_g1_i1~~c11157_g1_i1.p1  ORF type:complete len:239 (+),score=38.33 c11157_g1_i1:7-723(+)
MQADTLTWAPSVQYLHQKNWTEHVRPPLPQSPVIIEKTIKSVVESSNSFCVAGFELLQPFDVTVTTFRIQKDETPIGCRSAPITSTPNNGRALTRRFSCDVIGCQKSYTDRSSLAKHKKTHTGERPYVCPFANCGKAFVLSSHLNRHKGIHTGHRPHRCLVDGCGKRFLRPDELKNHSRVHTGERPCVCPVEGCGMTFAQASTLSRHKKTHSERIIIPRAVQMLMEMPMEMPMEMHFQ